METGYEQLYEECFAGVAGALTLYLDDPLVAEELAQEAFVRAAQHWSTVKRADRPNAWIYRVAFNLANSHLRRKVVERRTLSKLKAKADATLFSPDASDALAVREALKLLPRRERQAVVLRYFGDLTLREVALALDCPEGTAATLVRRAKNRLRPALRVAEEEMNHVT